MIKIRVYAENEILLTCKYIWLEPLATGTSRRFTFQNISATSRKRVLQKTNDEGFHIGANKLKILISIRDKSNQWSIVYDFKVYLTDYGDLNNSSLWISGFIYDDDFKEYRQGIVDIFNLWSKSQNIKWADLSLKSPIKEDYIYSCFLYSRITLKIFERSSYRFDMTLINEVNDFLYFAALEFIGEKGYLGNSIHTFKDCLIQIHYQGELKKIRNILFINVSKISNSQVFDLYQDVKAILERFNFTIEEA